jgi:hypothetical protein
VLGGIGVQTVEADGDLAVGIEHEAHSLGRLEAAEGDAAEQALGCPPIRALLRAAQRLVPQRPDARADERLGELPGRVRRGCRFCSREAGELIARAHDPKDCTPPDPSDGLVKCPRRVR